MRRTLLQQLQQSVERSPQQTALIEPQRITDYRTLGKAVEAVGGFLASHIRTGDRVALLLENSAEYAAACYGVWFAGGVVVGLNTALKARDLGNLVDHAGAKWIIADSGNSELALVLQGRSLQVIDCAASPISGAITWLSILEQAQPSKHVAADVLDADAAIIYTSGTTGHPKGVVLTHRNLSTNIASIHEYLPIISQDRMLCVLPFYYSYGNSVLHSHLSRGATLVLENSLMYPHKVLARMAELKATAFAGVPSTFYLFLSRARLQDFDLSAIRYCTQAGGAMDKARIAQWCEAVPGAEFYVMYGQTEAAARLTWLPPSRLHAKAGSVGVPIPGVAISVRDERDREVAAGETGEICARGDNVMRGYWRDEQETAAVLRNGWLHTGDLGYRDADGFIYLIGRNREMIKTGAHRVSPREIEELIATVPGVEEVAVIGMADDVLGQVIRACVVPGTNIAGSDHDALRKQIMRLCREQLAMYKMPKHVSFHDGFPRTASGKIQKHLIT